MANNDTLPAQGTTNQRAIISVAQKIHDRYLTKENMYLILLTGTSEQIRYLKMADILYRSVYSAVMYNQCRRAVLYLGFYRRLCRRIFATEQMKETRQRLDKRIFSDHDNSR